jgi:hypothetical protein
VACAGTFGTYTLLGSLAGRLLADAHPGALENWILEPLPLPNCPSSSPRPSSSLPSMLASVPSCVSSRRLYDPRLSVVILPFSSVALRFASRRPWPRNSMTLQSLHRFQGFFGLRGNGLHCRSLFPPNPCYASLLLRLLWPHLGRTHVRILRGWGTLPSGHGRWRL